MQRAAGVILCGGQASRFGSDKSAALLDGRPLLAHVAERLQPQVSRLFLSAQPDATPPGGIQATLIPDVVQRHRGPLAGLYSALEHISARGDARFLLLCPCDAPFLPRDLSERLFRGLREANVPVAVAHHEGAVQPTFSLWSLAALPGVRETVLDKGAGGLMRMLDAMPHTLVDWPASALPPFFNVNTPEDLAAAERLLDAEGA